MKVSLINNTSFGITTKTFKEVYAPNCWNEISEGAFKDYSFKIYNNYQLGKKGSTLIIFKQAGKWIKSKLKYVFNGERKTIWSYAKGYESSTDK